MSKTTKVADAKVKLSLEDKLTAPLKRVQERFQKLSHSLSIPRFSAAVKNMTASLHGVQSALGTAASRASVFTGALGLAGGGLVASLTAVTMKTMHLGDSLHHASRHLGMSVAALQLWGDAADNSGYSAELFQQSLATLNRRSAQAFAGQKRGIMGFEALGISVKNASGKLKSNSVLLEEITDKMSKMKNQAQRQHIAALLFGGDGKEMAAMLAQGMAPIKELFAKARKGKWLIGADVARYAADLSDKLGAFKKKIGGITSFIGARFMPVINDMIDAFSKLIDENRDLIQTTVAGWAKTLKKVLKDLFNPTSDLRRGISDLTERIKSWFRWMEPLIGEITLFKVGIVALGSFIFGPLIAALTAAGAAFVTLGYTIMTTPIGWLIGGIAALVGAGYLLYKNWDTVVSFISNLWNSFANLCSNIFSNLFTLFKNFSPLSWIAKKINALIDWLFGVNLMEAGANLINGLWEGIKSQWQALSEWFSGMISTLTSWMPNWVKEKLGFNVSINKTSTQTIKTFTEETNARAKRMVDTAVVSNPPSGKGKSGFNTGAVETRYMEAPNAKVAAFKAPKPITVHKPVEVDARVTITNLNISVPNGLKDEIRDAVNQALERYAKQQRLAIASSLSD
ncbi:phage tail tape measure protein [Bartonella taylorii]|uniref:Phage tail tape measure protein, TP901 family, core region n=1 Tax=Bartonella taylorii 8TBB TaxID=1094560 RepID=A0A9P2W2X0_BARTA|nr:phage tail tape measure protein [Bartonella taylorii]EJF95955.1 phage tail tape measure protein, TP901 family, core region [Bartonella taylorii 8TBB]USP01769.1 phage tail tape measure protein [Bartonella taylorii]